MCGGWKLTSGQAAIIIVRLCCYNGFDGMDAGSRIDRFDRPYKKLLEVGARRALLLTSSTAQTFRCLFSFLLQPFFWLVLKSTLYCIIQEKNTQNPLREKKIRNEFQLIDTEVCPHIWCFFLTFLLTFMVKTLLSGDIENRSPDWSIAREKKNPPNKHCTKGCYLWTFCVLNETTFKCENRCQIE